MGSFQIVEELLMLDKNLDIIRYSVSIEATSM